MPEAGRVQRSQQICAQEIPSLVLPAPRRSLRSLGVCLSRPVPSLSALTLGNGPSHGHMQTRGDSPTLKPEVQGDTRNFEE